MYNRINNKAFSGKNTGKEKSMISYLKASSIFAVETENTSLLLKADNDGILRTLYYGKKISYPEETFFLNPSVYQYKASNEKRPLRPEFPTRQCAYYCTPCLSVIFPDKTRDLRLEYDSFKISENNSRLEIYLFDKTYMLKVALIYKTYDGLDLIDKNCCITNLNNESVTLTSARSAAVTPEWNVNYRLTTFAGSWGAEYKKHSINLCQGKFSIGNTRGTAGSHQNIPFFALDDTNATETCGNVWYGLLHYSGDFVIDFEYDFTEQLTVSAGINEFDTRIELGYGESYETPVFTTGFSSAGFEKMTETLYDYQYSHLLPQTKIKNIFPIIYNTWYPYKFDVDSEKCLSFIDKAKEIGAELFVIDDGWFGRRESDATDGLGDWYCHKRKFPDGLKIIADKVHSLSMKFGLWIEPEMVNLKSDLYKEHPEWVITNNNLSPSMIRNQCVLNLARDDVKEFVWDTCDRLISEFDLDYLKWDMNAYFTETGKSDGDFRIRYIKNLYGIWERINKKYPHVLLENCASGGGRADYGLAKYSDRINRSDNSDPVDVLKLHEGFSTIFLPRLTGGAGNIAQSPHTLNGRTTPLKFRATLGMTGSMSVGVNILKSDENEFGELKYYISEYKKIRHITQNAYFYRISSSFENPYTVWEYLAKDKRAAVIFVFAHGMNFKNLVPLQKLRGLNGSKIYKIYGEDRNDPDKFRTVHGDTLMNFGIKIEPFGDYFSQILRIEEA